MTVRRMSAGLVEDRRLAVELNAVFSLVLKTLLILFPLLSALVFATLLALNGTVLSPLDSLLVTSLFI